MKALKDIYIKELYRPSALSVLINPFFISRNWLNKSIAILGKDFSGNLLDIGCGRKPYKSHFPMISSYIGLEIDSKLSRSLNIADVFYSGKVLPFQNNSFDNILCSQVLEHVFDPQNFLAEVRRLLRKNGLLLITTPFAWDEHEQPEDFARYSSFGLIYLLEKSNFEVIKAIKTSPDISSIAQLLIAYIYKVTRSRVSFLNFLIQVLIICPITIIGITLGKFFPRNYDFYLDNIIIAKAK